MLYTRVIGQIAAVSAAQGNQRTDSRLALWARR
jgi:hypothetical protein